MSDSVQALTDPVEQSCHHLGIEGESHDDYLDRVKACDRCNGGDPGYGARVIQCGRAEGPHIQQPGETLESFIQRANHCKVHGRESVILVPANESAEAVTEIQMKAWRDGFPPMSEGIPEVRPTDVFPKPGNEADGSTVTVREEPEPTKLEGEVIATIPLDPSEPIELVEAERPEDESVDWRSLLELTCRPCVAGEPEMKCKAIWHYDATHGGPIKTQLVICPVEYKRRDAMEDRPAPAFPSTVFTEVEMLSHDGSDPHHHWTSYCTDTMLQHTQGRDTVEEFIERVNDCEHCEGTLMKNGDDVLRRFETELVWISCFGGRGVLHVATAGAVMPCWHCNPSGLENKDFEGVVRNLLQGQRDLRAQHPERKLGTQEEITAFRDNRHGGPAMTMNECAAAEETEPTHGPQGTQGWQCPKCEVVFAPWIAQCHCQNTPTARGV